MGKFTRRFSDEQERAILSIFFTNPHENVSFVIPGRDFGPEEQAALAAKYSRSDKPYQAKFLELVEKDQGLDMDYIDELIRDPNAVNRLSIGGKSLRTDAARFHERWSLGFTPEEKDVAIRGFGDDSIKDGANLLYHVDHVTDNDNKTITQNPRNRPQVVSTRYINRSNVLEQVEKNPDIKASKHGEEILGVIKNLGDTYVRFTDLCADFVEKHPLNQEFREKAWLSDNSITSEIEKWIAVELKKDPEQKFSDDEIVKKRVEIRTRREKDYLNYARKTVFDYTRYLLFPAIPTSMAIATDARTLEEDITNLLSSPLTTSRELGDVILTEGRKVSPTLLGERSHAKRNDFIVNLRQELSNFVKTKIETDRLKIFNTMKRTNYVDKDVPSFDDLQLAACLVFPYSNCSLRQLYLHFVMNRDNVDYVVDTVLRLRDKFDQDPHELLHGGLMRETLVDYGAYRDIQRHRRGFKSRQLLTTYHGYEVPDLIPIAGLEKEFRELMEECDTVYRRISDDNPYVAQLMVPFAFKVRSLYSWQFGQDLFFAKLRSGEGGIISYRKVAWDIEDADRERMPKFSRLFRVNRATYPAELINLKEAKQWYNKKKRGA